MMIPLASLAPLALTALLLRGCMVLLVAAGLIGCLRIPHSRKKPAKGAFSAVPRVLASLFSLAALAILAYQATWQLGGFRERRLMDFMERHTRRPANPAASAVRGRILDMNGLELAVSDSGAGHQRRYPLGAAAAHAVGYKHPTYGRNGVESAHDSHLRGATVALNAASLKALGRNLMFHDLIEGNDVVLTLDARLQQLAAAQLGGRRGVVVGLDPRTGAIRILVSSPSFDPRHPGDYVKAAQSPLLNRATQGLYPPGSTFKTLIAAVAIQQGQTGELDCPAEGYAAEPGVRPIRDHEYYESEGAWFNKWHGHGRIALGTALRKSSNVYFSQRGVLLGGDAIHEAIERWQLDEPLTYFRGTDGVLSSKACRVPALTTRREIAQVAIGQGRLLVTPLHMACVAAAVANDGRLMAPQLDAAQPTHLLATTMQPQQARQLGRMLQQAVSRGTGRGAMASGVSVCGKTGTAQAASGADHAWFICYAPAEQPHLALAVLVEHGGYGSASAVPIAATILRRAKELGLLGEVP